MAIYIPILVLSAIVALLVCLARPLVARRVRPVKYYVLRLVGVNPHTIFACDGAGTCAQCALHRDRVSVAGSCRDTSSLDLRRVRERQQAMFQAVRDIHLLNHQQEELERALKAASREEGAGMA